MNDYYQPDLAWVHHNGYSGHVEQTRAGIMRRLRDHGLARGAHVLDVGCGSGLLARALLAEGFRVSGVDASDAMIELARAQAPAAQFSVVALPLRDGEELPASDAVVATGHVLNYLDSRDDIVAALANIGSAVRYGGLLAMDLMTERFCEKRDLRQPHAQVHDEWAIVTRFSRPEPFRYDRAITVFRRVQGSWRRSDEHHRNITFEADDALAVLREVGLDAEACASYGDETLPEGLVVLIGRRAV